MFALHLLGSVVRMRDVPGTPGTWGGGGVVNAGHGLGMILDDG